MLAWIGGSCSGWQIRHPAMVSLIDNLGIHQSLCTTKDALAIIESP